MNPREFLSVLAVAERLKCNTRHCYTSTGRHESVAEHSWRAALMAMLLRDEFPEADMDKVIRMCLIHDLGEAFTGDIPVFLKTDADSAAEDACFRDWVESMPADTRDAFSALLEEMDAMETPEARIYKAIDKLEALIQHNESDLSTWIPLEYELQLTYGQENMQFSPYMQQLRLEVDRWTQKKIEESTI